MYKLKFVKTFRVYNNFRNHSHFKSRLELFEKLKEQRKKVPLKIVEKNEIEIILPNDYKVRCIR